jgi:hypothetical protein
MLDIAISIGSDDKGISLVETNHGVHLKAPTWPQDSESRLVAFNPTSKICEVIWPEHLAVDIGHALRMLRLGSGLKHKKPDWYQRLAQYAEGAS